VLSLTDDPSKAIVEKILKLLTVGGKDVRKADWNNKQVIIHSP